MDFATYVDHVRRDGRLLAATARGDLTAAVPSCPGWIVGDVVEHVAQVYDHKIQCTLLQAEPDPWPPAWPADRDPVAWFADAHDRLVAMFEERGHAAPSATWWPPDQTVGFWARRMAQETAVHRVDVQLGLGHATSVDPDLAVDGIDEVLAVFLAGDWSEAPADGCSGQRAAVAAGGRRWIVSLQPQSVEVAEGDAGDRPVEGTVEGSPSDLLLWLWGRAPDERVERHGDPETLALLRGRLVLATQ